MSRIVNWFSCGAASAVATKLTLTEHPEAEVVRIYLANEHEDNERFARECEEWFGKPITTLTSDKYADCWQVWESERFLVSQFGAPCTAKMKKAVRYGFERPDDIQVFGYTAEEEGRAERFRQQNPGVDLATPLIDFKLSKQDCLTILERAGIELPAMYRLGYSNNNCVGCVKGGMGYWNRIRVDFPEVFNRMARLERNIGHALNKDKNGPVYLDELDPKRGNFKGDSPGECGITCELAEQVIEEAVV